MQGLGEQQLWSWDPWVAGCKVPRGVCSVSAGHPTSTQSIRLPAASCPTNCRSPGTSSEGSQRPRRFSAKRALRTQGLALRSLGKFPYSGHPPFYLEKRAREFPGVPAEVTRTAGQERRESGGEGAPVLLRHHQSRRDVSIHRRNTASGRIILKLLPRGWRVVVSVTSDPDWEEHSGNDAPQPGRAVDSQLV